MAHIVFWLVVLLNKATYILLSEINAMCEKMQTLQITLKHYMKIYTHCLNNDLKKMMKLY